MGTLGLQSQGHSLPQTQINLSTKSGLVYMNPSPLCLQSVKSGRHFLRLLVRNNYSVGYVLLPSHDHNAQASKDFWGARQIV